MSAAFRQTSPTSDASPVLAPAASWKRRRGRRAAPVPADKRVFDIAVALFLIILLAPLMALVALWVRLDSPGPVLFRQRRAGLHGAAFTLLKFRTMRPAPPPRAGAPWSARLAAIQPPPHAGAVTRAGRFLRRSRLDELPQLFNVLAGDMSLVGPRPHMYELDALFAAELPHIVLRRAALPGLTGLAQIRGRIGPTPDARAMAARLDDDLDYIRRRSLLLDVGILLATPLALLRAPGRGRAPFALSIGRHPR
ncbi:sugar transferase [Camelimonas abortus]|uniref:Sugar transferase n=1 Tax=Camelimonas abortus TaxID=1017184 RepID=A0ABV7LBG9_9HYPH